MNESQKRINRLVDENEQLTAKNLNLQEEIQKIDRMLATITQGTYLNNTNIDFHNI